MKIDLPPEIEKVIQILDQHNREAYVVGGCVRDSMMGLIPHDWDITTSALPNEMLTIFKDYRVIETGIQHGTVTVILDKTPVEITTFRIDGAYKDNRHPEKVDFTTKLSEDLSRRDFTINALAYHPIHGLIDLYDGLSDINNKIIRCVGESDKRFQEDALRIMRALRFSSTLNFEIEPLTVESIHKNRALLKNISVERLSSELNKLLCGDNIYNILMIYADIIFEIIPELKLTQNCSQKNIYHIYDVWQHTAVAVSKIEKSKLLRLTMLLHDIAKPLVKTADQDGTTHFKTHASLGSKMTTDILRRMKYDKKTVNAVTDLVLHHDDRLYNHPENAKKHLNQYGYDFLLMLDKVSRADILAQNPAMASRLHNCDAYFKKLTLLNEDHNCLNLSDVALDGNDIIALGFSGKMIGIILNDLLQNILEDRLKNTKSSLTDYILKKYKKAATD